MQMNPPRWMLIASSIVLATCFAFSVQAADPSSKELQIEKSSTPESKARQRYIPLNTTCDGYPRLPIDMAPGLCAGLIIAPPESFSRRTIKTPRVPFQLSKSRWLVTDLGSWTPSSGALWQIQIQPGEQARVTKVLGGLSLPHTIARGPDGKIYVGEMSRIIRIDVDAPKPSATIQVIVDRLPDNRLHENRHPLSHFIFDANGDLLVNIGAPSDQCTKDTLTTCSESQGVEAKGVIRRYGYMGDGRWATTFSVVASGLRNSLVLVRHQSGTIIQGENSYDYAPNADKPHDEINVIQQGAHYGWPYCADMNLVTPAWLEKNAMDCASSAHAKPAVLLPPHVAPLGALYYAGAMFPRLQGKLLMTWHGYRAAGSRLVAFDVDNKGVPVVKLNARYAEYANLSLKFSAYGGPAAEPNVLTPGWNLVRESRPAGAPVGIAVADDGAIWLADDRNAVVMRIAADRP